MQKPKEFEITLKLKVEADNLTVAEYIATAIVHDLEKAGQEYVDRPINHVRWQRIKPVFEKPLHRAGCPGCINCGPPIMVKADDGCDGRLEFEPEEDPWVGPLPRISKTMPKPGGPS